MNKTRFAVKAVLTGVVSAVLLVGGTAGPVQAKDTGWGIAKDTGWGVTTDTGWGIAKDTGWG